MGSKHGKDVAKLSSKGKQEGKATSKSKQQSAINEKEQFVKDTMSNEIKPFTKEASTNLTEVKNRGGVSDADAKIAVEHAEKVYSQASKLEPQITKDVVSSVKDVDGTMYGLDFRLKQPTSMAGKIASDHTLEGKTFSEASSGIKDAIRYTAILDEGSFTKGYNSIKSSLEAKGYTEFRCKNFYTMYKNGNSQQKAIQCVFKSKDGQFFEFQFHTTKSQGVKELLHPMYEEYRRSSTSTARKNQLDKSMKELSSHVSNPSGVFSIINY